jgi:hypothetical protein
MVRKFIPVEALELRARNLREQMARLQQELTMLEALMGSAIEERLPDAPPSDKKQTLTDTVAYFIAGHPHMTSTQVADMLVERFEANGEAVGGADPRKTILTTIGAMVQRKRLHRDPATGRLTAD